MAGLSFITAGAASAPLLLLFTVLAVAPAAALREKPRRRRRDSKACLPRRKPRAEAAGAMRSLRCAPFLFLLLSAGEAAVITGACERDLQCGGGMCCAISLWIRSLRMCTPMGHLGEDCHPLSHKIPFHGRRLHHTCPCAPNLACVQISPSKYKCLPDFTLEDAFF